MKRFALLALFPLSIACASTGTSRAPSAQVPPAQVAIARATPSPLPRQALDLFAAAAHPDQGLSISVDLDALRARGILPSGEEIPGGYTFVQFIAPFVSELTTFKSEWTKPLSELIVFASLLDRAVPFPEIKRLGVYVPGEDLLNAQIGELLHGSVVLLGIDADAVSARALLENYAALIRAARPALAAVDAGDGGLPEVALQSDSLCVVEGEDRAPKACLLGGDGVYALGSPAAIASLKARVTPPTVGDGELQFAQMVFADAKIGRLTFRSAGTDDLTLTIALESPTEEASLQFAQVANLLLARRQQAQREFEMATAIALQNAQQSIAQDAQAPAPLRAMTAGLTVETLFDPHGTDLMNPDNVTLAQTGKLLTFGLRLPAAYVDRSIVTMRNMSAFEFSLYSGLSGLALTVTHFSGLFSALPEAPDTSEAIEGAGE